MGFFRAKKQHLPQSFRERHAIGRPLVNSASHWFITDRKRRVWGRGGARDGENDGGLPREPGEKVKCQAHERVAAQNGCKSDKTPPLRQDRGDLSLGYEPIGPREGLPCFPCATSTSDCKLHSPTDYSRTTLVSPPGGDLPGFAVTLGGLNLDPSYPPARHGSFVTMH